MRRRERAKTLSKKKSKKKTNFFAGGNSIETKAGDDRSMYVYVPASAARTRNRRRSSCFCGMARMKPPARRPCRNMVWMRWRKGAFVLASPIRGKAAGAKGTRKTWTISPAALWPCRRAREGRRVHRNDLPIMGGSPSAGALLLAMSARRPGMAGVLPSELLRITVSRRTA